MKIEQLLRLIADDPMFIVRLNDVIKTHPSDLTEEYLNGNRYNVETRMKLPHNCTTRIGAEYVTLELKAVNILNSVNEQVSYGKKSKESLTERVRYDRILNCSIREWEIMCKVGKE